MSRQGQRMLDLLIFGALGSLPGAFGWSRRTSKTIAIAGFLMAGLSASPVAARRPLGRLTACRREVAGLFLLGAQYQLTEEESSVHGMVAVMGVALVLIGLVVRLLDCNQALAEASA